MQGVGPGTVLGERYCLRHLLSQGRDLELWSAHDATLRREVAVTLISASHPNQPGALDAARRAAGVEDARLVRILDVGTHNDSSFIVQEALNGSQSLATILLQGRLPAEEARRVAGEAAKGLEAAGVRGLHHLRLTPHHVLIAPDGAIRVSGVSVAAATEGPYASEPDSAMALHRDAVCLVAIIYAALTTAWPLDEEVRGLRSAPQRAEGVVAPSQIVAGVPGDLDALCRMALSKGAGPMTPAVVANRIAPWQRERVHRAGTEATVVLPLPSWGDRPGDGAGIAVGAEPTVATSTHGSGAQSPSGRPVGSATPPGVLSVPQGRTQSSPRSDMQSAAAHAPAGGKASTAGAATTTALGAAPSGVGGATSARTGKPAVFAAGAGPSSAPATAEYERQGPRLAVGLAGGLEDLEPPVPLLPASTALPPSRGQSKIVILVVAAFVAISLFLGYRGLLGMNGPSLSRPAAAVSTPAAKTPASPAPQAAATAAGPIAIASATGFDPQGDQVENNSQAARVYDGDPTTTWTSELYATAQFGALKQGVGLLLDLGTPRAVHQVTIDLGNGPLDLTAYAANGPSLQGATVIGTASAASGRIQLKAASTVAASQYVIIWFTSLGPDDGKFGATVQEIALS